MAATAVHAGGDRGEASRRVRSPSPALPLLDPRCCGDDFSFEGAGFEELLRSFGGGLDSPPPGAGGALPHAPPQSELALALPLPQHASRTPDAVGPRCLDATHASGGGLGGACACTPAPLEGQEAQYELLSNENGKKNGEKRRAPHPTPLAPLARAWYMSRVRLTRRGAHARLRSQLSRTPEWRSLAERERVARACDAAGPARAALAQALRVGHCSLLRKGDLLFLARVWGYRSDIWGHRKDRRVRGPLPAATSLSAAVPRGVAAVMRAPLALEPAAITRPEVQVRDACRVRAPMTLLTRQQLALVVVQISEFHAALGGPLRALAESSLEAFASYESVGHRIMQLSHREGAAAQLRGLGRTAFTVLEVSAGHKCGALGEINRLLAMLQMQHADVQLRMLRVDPAQAGRPAFLALASEVEAPWELLFRDIARLCNSAITSESNKPTLICISAAGNEVDEQTSIEAAKLDALTAGCDVEGIVRGGEISLEVLVRSRAMLHQMRLAPLEAYLSAVSAVLSLQVGMMSGCADSMAKHVRTTQQARDVLTAAHTM